MMPVPVKSLIDVTDFEVGAQPMTSPKSPSGYLLKLAESREQLPQL